MSRHVVILASGETERRALAFPEPRLREAYRILAPHGSFYLHVDYREVHRCRFLLDDLFGPDNILNEIIWAYDYGALPKTRWPAKHDNILFYVKDVGNYVFNVDEIERIPYMAPGLVGPERAARGKLPTDTWWHTIVPTNGAERTGYPTQKPLGVLRRIVTASSRPGDTVLDFFAGSGTTGMAAHELGRGFILVDNNPEALAVMAKRFADVSGIRWEGFDPSSLQEPRGNMTLSERGSDYGAGRSGAAGGDTFWLSFRAAAPPGWLDPCGGRLAEVHDIRGLGRRAVLRLGARCLSSPFHLRQARRVRERPFEFDQCDHIAPD